MSLLFLAALALLPLGCKSPSAGLTTIAVAPPAHVVRDVHSFSRPDEVVVRHLALDLVVNFDRQVIAGAATLHIENIRGVDELFLDTRDLDIHRVTLGEERMRTEFTLGEETPFLGRALRVAISPDTTLVRVEYSSRPEAAAVQWLTPEQTSGDHPFLFTQSQAILARTWVPCQDTPMVRMTYEAKVRVPAGMLALMSAENPIAKNVDGVYEFTMPQAIPSYLLALAVGDLEFRALDGRSGVYAEPTVVEKAAWELADTPKMIESAEALYGPYRWGRYDILILPPSFPFGGMENPRLTFATPTILAGDRSLVALIAHELAHSWSGNLVTNATWNDFWLNEGFTNYFTQRIMESVYGLDYAEMLALLSLQDLRGEIQDIGAESPDTHLFLNLSGRDPDDGMTSIAYDKGYFFLRLLEETAGRKNWDGFLRSYFDRYAFSSMTTSRFLDHLRKELIVRDASIEYNVGIDRWVFGPGLPDNASRVESPAFDLVDAELARFGEGADASELEVEGWTTHHWRHFLRNLPQPMSFDQMRDLDATFGFSKTGNSEVLHAWLLQAIDNRYEPAYGALEEFLTSMGRRKFLSPLYSALAKTDEGTALAREIYGKARATYHPIAQISIDETLGWTE